MTAFLSRIGLRMFQKTINKKFICSLTPECIPSLNHLFSKKNDLFCTQSYCTVRKYSVDAIHPPLALDNASLPLKKKTVYKKAVLEEVTQKEGHYLTLAYATAEAYDLKGLKEALVQQKLYEPGT